MLTILLVPMQETPNCDVQEFGSHPSPSRLHYCQTIIEEALDDADDEPGPTDPSRVDSDDNILLEEIYSNVKIDDLHIALKYVRSLQNASLDDRGVGLDERGVDRLRNPPTDVLWMDGNKNLETAIKLYLGLPHADSDYDMACRIFMEQDSTNCSGFPSLFQVKEAIARLTGIEAVVHDMYVNSCMVFTGPFSELNHCAECGQSRWDQDLLQEFQGTIKSPRKQFSTLLLGTQLQAVFHDPTKAREMQYWRIYTRQIIERLKRTGGIQETFNDFFDGLDYLEEVKAGNIKDEDVVLMFSHQDCHPSIIFPCVKFRM